MVSANRVNRASESFFGMGLNDKLGCIEKKVHRVASFTIVKFSVTALAAFMTVTLVNRNFNTDYDAQACAISSGAWLVLTKIVGNSVHYVTGINHTKIYMAIIPCMCAATGIFSEVSDFTLTGMVTRTAAKVAIKASGQVVRDVTRGHLGANSTANSMRVKFVNMIRGFF